MAEDRPLPELTPGSPSADSFPALANQFDWIRETLKKREQLGLLSVTVLQRGGQERPAAWQAYEAMTREISRFLGDYSRDKMRRNDRLIGPSSSGNAFVLLLDRPRDGRRFGFEEIRRVQHRIRRALQGYLSSRFPREISEALSCYVGGSMIVPEPSVRLERIVYRALDQAFADALRAKRRESRRHLVQLERILRAEAVRSVYQPVVDLIDRKTIGYEALTRVPPGRFDRIDLLFKTAQDHDVLWNLERLCRRRALEGLPRIESDQLLFLNIEPDSIHDPQLGDLGFEGLLDDAGLRAEQVVLEVTEHSAVQDFGTFRRSLNRFRQRGFRVAMDDVGSGYAGLQAIAELAPNFIKVDMTLVRDIHTNTIKRELIATIRRFADSTGIKLIAEGVETHDELRSLLDVGVRCAQGFLFARPGSPPEHPDWTALDSEPS
jgi:EAL domain-containing protein (putative c-di-GMP-specific phosphodiesterase class I)